MNNRIKEIEERYKKEIEELKDKNKWLEAEIRFYKGLKDSYKEDIENKKVIIEELEYNVKRSNKLNVLLKKELDETVLKYNKAFYDKSLTYNDLLHEIQNKTDLTIVSIINKDNEDKRIIRLYNNNESKIINEIIDEFNDFDIEIQKNVYVGHDYKTIDVLTFLLSNELLKDED